MRVIGVDSCDVDTAHHINQVETASTVSRDAPTNGGSQDEEASTSDDDDESTPREDEPLPRSTSASAAAGEKFQPHSDNNNKKSSKYDYNPIANYFFYNMGTDKKSVDERRIEADPFVARMFQEHNLKICKVNMFNCFKEGVFKDVNMRKMPIKLTPQIKQLLRIPDSSSTPVETNSNVQAAAKKPAVRYENNQFNNLQ